MKIVLIGPVYPYKGGIAHYTSLMYRALCKKHDVTLISYRMQYPKILFKKAQKDYSNDLFKVDDVQFIMNTANLFNIIGVARRINKVKPDMVIMQWWHPYFAPCYRILCGSLNRQIKKIFICHNVFPHERFPMDRFLTKMTLKKGDGFIVHSKSDGKDLESIDENLVYRENPHPTYNAFKIANLSKKEARGQLGIDADKKLLLFFGFVREYKGLKYLLNAMPALKEQYGNGIKLLVVGSFDGDKDNYMKIVEDNNINDVVDVIDGYIPDNEVEKYFAACDLVVLPYETATQSGIVQIAYGFEKPVIVTNVGGLPDVVEDGVTGYVVEPKNEKTLAKRISDYYMPNVADCMKKSVKECAYRFDWDRIVEKIEELRSDCIEG